MPQSAEPIRIGITTILSGPIADRGQSEQYGAQLAMDRINEAGGVLGRPLEAEQAFRRALELREASLPPLNNYSGRFLVTSAKAFLRDAFGLGELLCIHL